MNIKKIALKRRGRMGYYLILVFSLILVSDTVKVYERNNLTLHRYQKYPMKGSGSQ